jgi:cytochrome c biogenesis protein CcmG/thiol:disulfide interchange protein DsbE
MRLRGKYTFVAAVVCLIGALVGLLAWRLTSDASAKGLIAAALRGEKPAAPDFTLPRLGEDGTLTLSSLRGKVVVLNIWASWCVPCRDEAPVLEQAYERWRDRGVVVLGIDQQDVEGDALAFVREHGLTYPSVRDGEGSVPARFGATGVPETFFIDRQGRIVGYFSGPLNLDPAALERDIQHALGL